MLGNDELLGAPFFMENPAHRRAILQELQRVQTLGVKPPRDLWEYKVCVRETNSGFTSTELDVRLDDDDSDL